VKRFRPGEFPPTFIPYCALCDLPVARLAYRVPKEDSWAIEFMSQCCGKTQGRRITFAEMYRVQQTGEKFYLIVQKARVQQIKAAPKKARVA